jgi:hypothetical protein
MLPFNDADGLRAGGGTRAALTWQAMPGPEREKA